MPLPAVPSSRTILFGACISAAVILASAGAYRYLHQTVQPVLTPVQFQPLTGVVAEQTRNAFQAHASSYFTEEENKALNQTPLTWAPIKKDELQQPGSQQGEYVARAESPQLCTPEAGCPTAIFKPRSSAPEPRDQLIYLTQAKNVTTTNQGNPDHPDILLNAGVPDAYLIRLKWEALDDAQPGYIPYVEQRNPSH